MIYASILNIAEAETVATKRGLQAWLACYLRYASAGKKASRCAAELSFKARGTCGTGSRTIQRKLQTGRKRQLGG
jgi:hypothetical protein